MRNTFSVFIIVFLIFSCKKDTQKPMADQSLPFIEKIDTIIQDYIDLEIFSGIVLIAKDGNIKYHQAFGLGNRDINQSNTINTLFDIGSMNKTFTSIVVKQLAHEGKLNLDDKLTKYISGFNDPNTKDITINHLLNHQSGFADYHTRDYFELPINERSLSAITERAKSYQLNFKPGTEQDYSNLGYVILGAVIETISGKSYFDNIRQRIVEPLHLKNTFLNNFESLGNRIAKGYYYTPLGELEESEPIQDLPNPDGGFLSTTEDIMKFYRSYYYDTVLLPESVKANDSYFNRLKTLPQGKSTGAFGGYEGFNTALHQIISDDLTVIVFANMDEPVAERIAMDILSLSRNETPEKPQIPAVQNVRIHYENHGVDYLKENFQALTVNFHPTDPKDFILNMLGYAYLYEANNTEKALEIFKLNVDLFPNVPNCWDSYGEALVKKGNTEEAIKIYKKALELDPDLESASEAIKNLMKN